MEKEYQSVAAKKFRFLSLTTILSSAGSIPKEIIERMAKASRKRLMESFLVRPSGSHYELILGRKRYYGAKAALWRSPLRHRRSER
jgi:hypothetical protein